MYKYHVRLWLSNDSLRKDINLETYKPQIMKAQEHYNSISAKARNKKVISSIKVENSEILIELVSNSSLNKPTIALKGLSHYLVTQSSMRNLVRNKALFRGTSTQILRQDDFISNESFLTRIIQIIYSDNDNDKQILTELKSVLINTDRNRKE